MKKIVVMSPNEKIKYLRKKYKIRQKDLSPSVCSVNFLSKIENGKVSVSEELAMRFYNRVKELLNVNENNLLYELSLEWLLEDVKIQIKKIVDDVIMNYCDYSKSDFYEIENLLIKYEENEQKIRLYSVIGSFEHNIHKNYNLSKRYYEQALPLVEKSDSVFEPLIYIQLQRIYINLADYEKLCSLFSNSLIRKFSYNSVLQNMLMYNFALAFQKNSNFNQAIEIYKEILNNNPTSKALLWSKSHLGVCYNRLKKFKQADRIFLDIVKKSKNSFDKIKAYSNILFYANEREDKKVIINIIGKIESLAEELPNNEKNQCYYCIGKAYLDLDNRLNAMFSFEKELELGLDLKNTHFFIHKYKRAIIELLKIYNVNDKRKLYKLKDKILDIPKEYLDHDFIGHLLYYYNKYFTKQEMFELYTYLKSDSNYKEF